MAVLSRGHQNSVIGCVDALCALIALELVAVGQRTIAQLHGC